ncbi:hypothetical protein [Rickettsia helvetica]|nr:hypothetical protein [Rickettsia helvetica]
MIGKVTISCNIKSSNTTKLIPPFAVTVPIVLTEASLLTAPNDPP